MAVSPYCWMRMSSAVYVVAGPAGARAQRRAQVGKDVRLADAPPRRARVDELVRPEALVRGGVVARGAGQELAQQPRQLRFVRTAGAGRARRGQSEDDDGHEGPGARSHGTSRSGMQVHPVARSRPAGRVGRSRPWTRPARRARRRRADRAGTARSSRARCGRGSRLWPPPADPRTGGSGAAGTPRTASSPWPRRRARRTPARSPPSTSRNRAWKNSGRRAARASSNVMGDRTRGEHARAARSRRRPRARMRERRVTCGSKRRAPSAVRDLRDDVREPGERARLGQQPEGIPGSIVLA